MTKIIEILEEITESGEVKTYLLVREESQPKEPIDLYESLGKELFEQLKESIKSNGLMRSFEMPRKFKPNDYGIRTRRPKLYS